MNTWSIVKVVFLIVALIMSVFFADWISIILFPVLVVVVMELAYMKDKNKKVEDKLSEMTDKLEKISPKYLDPSFKENVNSVIDKITVNTVANNDLAEEKNL